MTQLKNLQNYPNPTKRKGPICINYHEDPDLSLLRETRQTPPSTPWVGKTYKYRKYMYNIYNTNQQYTPLYQNQMTGHRPYAYNSRTHISRQQPTLDMTSYF